MLTSNFKKVLIGVGCIVAFALTVVVIIFYAGNKLTTTVNNQLAALRSGDFVKAYSYTSQDFRSVTSLKDFEEFVNHYPALRGNKKIAFSESEIRNDSGVVRGILRTAAGELIPIEYLLIKEDNIWKIMGIQVNPASKEDNSDISVQNSSEMNTYDNRESRYIIKYPANWEYERTRDGTIIFSGKRGTPAFFSTVNIQTVLTKKSGGDFSTVRQFISDIKHQAVNQSLKVRFLDSGQIVVNEKSGIKDKGEYILFTYKYKGKEFKQWQVVVLRNDEQVFYAWAYTAPIEQYDDNQAVAKAMLDSWIIY